MFVLLLNHFKCLKFLAFDSPFWDNILHQQCSDQNFGNPNIKKMSLLNSKPNAENW